jgi:GDP/UDP-N,N'-diacetylbacillosamine 2-epimerase (hydrolysing)
MKILVFTFSRADYGLIRWVVSELQKEYTTRLYVGGTHLSGLWGKTIEQIVSDGMDIAGTMDYLLSELTPEGITSSMGVGLLKISAIFKTEKPDFVIIVGDRWEMFLPTIAAVIFNTPIIHYYAGEVLPGRFEMTIDHQIRFAITAASHIFWVTTCEYAEVVSRTGQEDWRIHVIGTSGLENLLRAKNYSKKEILKELGIDLEKPSLIVTFHPPTLRNQKDIKKQILYLLKALDSFPDFQVIFTKPNAEYGTQAILDEIHRFISKRKNTFLMDSLGKYYSSFLRYCRAMIGNSSSGILEAPSFGIPIVNIGERQQGRLIPDSVICSGYRTREIMDSLKKALFDQSYIQSLKRAKNPYGDGKASLYALKAMKSIQALDRNRILQKILDFELRKNEWSVYL